MYLQTLHIPLYLCRFDRSCRSCFPACKCKCKSHVAQRRAISVCYRNQFSADQANAGRRLLPGHRAKAFCTPPEAKLSRRKCGRARRTRTPSADGSPFFFFFFFPGNNLIFLLFFFARRSSGRSIFSACINSRSRARVRRGNSLFYGTILSHFFLYVPLYFSCLFKVKKKKKKTQKFPTESFFTL